MNPMHMHSLAFISKVRDGKLVPPLSYRYTFRYDKWILRTDYTIVAPDGTEYAAGHDFTTLFALTLKALEDADNCGDDITITKINHYTVCVMTYRRLSTMLPQLQSCETIARSDSEILWVCRYAENKRLFYRAKKTIHGSLFIVEPVYSFF